MFKNPELFIKVIHLALIHIPTCLKRDGKRESKNKELNLKKTYIPGIYLFVKCIFSINSQKLNENEIAVRNFYFILVVFL